MEDEAAPIRLDQTRGAAHVVTNRSDRDRHAGQADVDPIDMKGPAKAPPEEAPPIRPLRPSVMCERDRNAGQENKGLRTVREGEVAGRRFFDQISGDVIAKYGD
jgi:hypothetical protein